MVEVSRSALVRAATGAALAAAVILPLTLPTQAKAWWVAPYGVYVAPPVVVAPPVYAPPPVAYAAPAYPYAYASPVWIAPRWYGGRWWPGYWRR